MVDIDDMEDSRIFLPPKLQTVANSIRKGLEVLEKGGRLRYPRKTVKSALDCGPFVSDSEILGILQDKLIILERESIFDGKRFNSSYERDIQTRDGDRVIFIELHKKKETHELVASPDSEFIPKDDKEGDDKDEYVVLPGTKIKLKNDKFVARLKGQEKEGQEKEKEEKQEKENQEKEESQEKNKGETETI